MSLSERSRELSAKNRKNNNLQNASLPPDHFAVLAVEDPSRQDELSPEAIRGALVQVLSCGQFRGSDRLKRFLRFVVEEKLAGRGDALKEYTIGLEVFDRGPSFDPRVDTIVRTEARKLRARLAEYYHGAGSADPIQIDFTRGCYAPVFHSNSPSPVQEASPDRAPVSIPAGEATFTSNAFAGLPRRGALLVAAAALVLAGGIYSLPFRSQPTNPPDVRSIAVLPFLDLSDNPDGDVFGDGLAEELIDSLGQVPGLHIVARTSAFQFKKRNVDIREIGRKLNVRNILEGSIRQSGNHLRISVRLEDAQNGYQLWSKSYDRELRDALAIQSEISRVVVTALGGELASGAPNSFRVASDNASYPEGYQDYLRGRYFLNKRTPENVQIAIDYFKQAVAKSPGYALAYTGLADCYAVSPVIAAAAGRDVAPKIREAALKALQLDPNLGDAHLSLAMAFEYEFNWPAANREFQKALEKSPGSADAHRAYSGYLSRMGRLEEGLAEKRRAFELDPVSPFAAYTIGSSLYWLRRYDEAIEQYQLAERLDPGTGFAHQGLGIAYIFKGQWQKGLPELELAHKLLEAGPFPSAELGYGYAVSGETIKARRVLNELLEQSRRTPIPAVAFAVIYVGLGDRENAIRWLQRAVEAHDVNFFPNDPLYDPLRSDPRFADLLARMGVI